MTTISAQTILRSRNASSPNTVLSTLLVRLPTVLLAEFNTHRAFSRNAASTRAISTERLIQQVLDDPFVPMHWGKNQPGMQAREECNAHVFYTNAPHGARRQPYGRREDAWLDARDRAVEIARGFAEAGYHKQIAGRLLAPFMWTIVCVSSTEWDNFLALRDHPDAEPHMQILAKSIRAELERDDNIQDLQPGQWHMPFVKDEDWPEIPDGVSAVSFRDDMIKLSVARCASTSYKTVDGFDMALDRAIALHDKLVGSRPLHASPCEHVAQADSRIPIIEDPDVWMWQHPHEHRNFSGFRQYRAQIERAV